MKTKTIIGLLLGSTSFLFAFPVESDAFSQKPLTWLDWLAETDTEISGYIEGGARSTLEDLEDVSADSDYTYAKYNLRFGQALTESFSYQVTGQIY